MTLSTIAAVLSMGILSAAAVSLEIPASVIWTIAGVLLSGLLGKDVWQRIIRSKEVRDMISDSDQPPDLKAKTPAGKRDALVLQKLDQIHNQQLDLRAHVDSRFDEASSQRQENRQRIDRLEALWVQGDET